MRAILVHGMGRTPASMLVLAARLRIRGFRPTLFAYSATFEAFASCSERLRIFIDRRRIGRASSSLVTPWVRSAEIRLPAPSASSSSLLLHCAAGPGMPRRRALAPHRLFKLATGEMGQLLANPEFMSALPVPSCATRIYAGTAGPIGRRSPFGYEPNDGILCVKETVIPGYRSRQ